MNKTFIVPKYPTQQICDLFISSYFVLTHIKNPQVYVFHHPLKDQDGTSWLDHVVLHVKLFKVFVFVQKSGNILCTEVSYPISRNIKNFK